MTFDHGTLPDIPPPSQGATKAAILNGIFFLVGIVGTPICVHEWQRHHGNPWLVAIGVFAYFLVSSISEPVLQSASRRRMKSRSRGRDKW